jgi:two-component system sensor histidine kinase/response regulator
MVCELANKLERQLSSQQNMSKIIEIDFLPRETDSSSSWPNSTPAFGITEKRRILIVDNDPTATHLVKILLEKTGRYLVFEENNSIRAHQSARDLRPDLILLDIVMPEADGGEIAARIQADPALEKTPIIFLTALVTRGEAKTGLHIDGHSFLAKPIDIQELIRAIEEHLPAGAKAFA